MSTNEGADASADSRLRSGSSTDATVLKDGSEALVAALGPSRALQFLALIAGGRDRFEEIRREWEDMSRADIVALTSQRDVGGGTP